MISVGLRIIFLNEGAWQGIIDLQTRSERMNGMKQAVIIGSGPAGISAALYLQRSGKAEVTVISNGVGALARAEKIENYYGFEEPVSGEELHRRGVAGAKRLGVKFVEDEVVSLDFESDLRLSAVTRQGRYPADVLLLATGAARKSVNIPGLREAEGRGVSYCAVCDAFFHRGKDVCVIGSGEYALHEALVLANTSASVTILTNGEELTTELPENIRCRKEKILSVNSGNVVEGVTLEGGETLACTGVFVAMGIADSGALARKVGAVVENGRIQVREDMSTGIPGLYAAGDCTGGMLQVYKAVNEGAMAGLAMIGYLREK